MKIFVGFGSYPLTTAALAKAGATIVDSLEEAEGFVFTQTPGLPFPDSLPESVTWVQLPQAGINHYFAQGVIDSSRRWSNASGLYGEQVAEAALTLLLALLHKLPTVIRADSWRVNADLDATTRWLRGDTVAMIGMGGIGQAFERMVAPFGVRFIGVGRNDNLHDALAQADHVVLGVPLTDATRGLMGHKEFAAMKPGATLINVARGEVVDTAALLAALDSGHLGAAGLDVTDPEPLPDGHPLWGRENVIITPHTANTRASMDELLAPLVVENYQLLLAGERMRTEVDPNKGY